VSESTIPALLLKRATEQPDATAYTYLDYSLDPAGYPEALTWSQVHRRSLAVAAELRHCGTSGDRVAILAPQGLEYIVAFLGALQAGFIAVPLSVPQFGIHDERVSSALHDSAPVALLTTSAVVGDVTKYARSQNGRPAPEVIEVDLLDFAPSPVLETLDDSRPGAAYLQYTSGSTRTPAGVIVSHANVITNLEQAMDDYFEGSATAPEGATAVSWLPFYHDMGLILGVCGPLVAGRSAVLLSPLSFLMRPACWMQLLATNERAFSAAPNFAFELAVRRTSDADMAGLDLGNVLGIVSGSERIHAATIKRFTERFSKFNLKGSVIRPSYGLAEATLYVATPEPGTAPRTARFAYDEPSAGHATRSTGNEGGTDLVSYGAPRASIVRIVDPETGRENPEGAIGEIWVSGDNVALGYWRKPEHSADVFGATITAPSAGTPAGPWLRTGDLGAMSEDELFIIGRIKDLLIVDGRNHYPDDIEATIQEITGGRVAAISVPDDTTENLVAIVELKDRGSADEHRNQLSSVKREVTSAISRSHSVRVSDLVVVSPGSIPITTSGKIRRSACIDLYCQDAFRRLDVSA
jgi:long-chain fatty acid adenylase/transferase FadD26